MSKANPVSPHRASLWQMMLLLALLFFPSPPRQLQAQSAPASKLEKAIAELRHIVPDKLTEAEQEAKSKAIAAAWNVIKAEGPSGLARLKQELQQVSNTNERDDFFKLNASALLWEIAKLNEAAKIAEVWNTTPLNVSYNYAFYPAMEAARTQDERALPMLVAILRDKDGQTFFPQHAMRVPWPLTHEFVWGAFGAKGLPVLEGILETSQNQVELQSASRLLGRAQSLKSLPRIREIAKSGTGEAKHWAIMALGIFGHPQDFDFLLSGLQSTNPVEVWPHVFALYEFEDLRAVPHLLPLLKSTEGVLRFEAISALRHLLTPAAMEALQAHSETTKDEREKERIKRHLSRLFEDGKTTWQSYLRKSPAQKEAFVAAFRQGFEDEYSLKKGERAMPRAEFLSKAAMWKEKGRLENADRGEVGVRHLLAATTANDIELLLDVKAKLYLRLSDECLYETQRIDRAVQHLGRSRYRKVTGITDKVETK